MSQDKAQSEPANGKRALIAKLVLGAVWLYVAMIYLLALDQQFHWGIFSP